MRVFGAVYWDQGGRITGGQGELWLRDDAGLRYDFSDGAWKAEPAQPLGAMEEDPAEPGYYRLSLDLSGWGSRSVKGQSRLFKDGMSDQVDDHVLATMGGLAAVPVFAPVPPAGVPVLLYALNPDGTPMQAPPNAYLTIAGPTPDRSSEKRTGAWDKDNGCWVWVVPAETVVLVSCLDLGICNGYSVGNAQLVVNGTNPIY